MPNKEEYAIYCASIDTLEIAASEIDIILKRHGVTIDCDYDGSAELSIKLKPGFFVTKVL